MIKFFFELTKRNWGFPYHWLIFYGVTQFIYAVGFWISRPGTWENFLRLAIINLLVNLVLWFLVEKLQDKKDTRSALVEDIAGDLAGYITGSAFTFWIWAIYAWRP